MPDLAMAMGAALSAMQRAASFGTVVTLACEACGTPEESAAIGVVAADMVDILENAVVALRDASAVVEIQAATNRERPRRAA